MPLTAVGKIFKPRRDATRRCVDSVIARFGASRAVQANVRDGGGVLCVALKPLQDDTDRRSLVDEIRKELECYTFKVAVEMESTS